VLWATQRLLPYVLGGTFARSLETGRAAALAMHARLAADPRFLLPIAEPELDILFWSVPDATVAESSAKAQAIFDESARRNLYLALAGLPVRFFPPQTWPGADPDAYVTCLRSVQMKPEHLAWGDEIWRRLDAATTQVLGPGSGISPN
jgi:hypothetical protein